MTIIPVIDLMAGQVVHARGGQRDTYRPITTQLANSSDPVAVVAGLRTFYRFNTVYVADLDAIQGGQGHGNIVQSLLKRFSDCHFWLDAGPATLAIARDIAEPVRLQPVCGSENHDCAALESIVNHYPNALLSLDFTHERLLGDPALLVNTWLWPGEIIVMSLDRVGSQLGPDLERIQELQTLNPDHDYYAAGGIRHDRDLQNLADIGINGALLATALHDQTLQGHRQ